MRQLILILVLALTQIGCSVDSLPFVYRPDVRQGNYIDEDMVATLRAGMTRSQVKFVLGSPMIEDPFQPDRWDYVSRLQPGHGEAEQKRLTVFFEGDRLVRVTGDFEPQDPSLSG